MQPREILVSRVADLEAASFSYSSLGGWDDIDKADALRALMRRCWRTRAYGDFWSYMMLAEGAVDIAAEPELKLWDMAALDAIVTEAGGRFTSLAGQPGPWGPDALATNGRLHDAAMAYLGHFPDDGPHDELWGDEPEGDETPDQAPDDNVRTLDFSRAWGDPDAP
jgi:histidinol-phosphatase